VELRLTDLEPPARIGVDGLVPPPRFDRATFASYEPQHPSQRQALDGLQAFAADAGRGAGFRFFWQRTEPGAGRYLDGGFGVGKTHLLAATFHAADVREKLYLSFQELVYLIGVLGMEEAQATFASCRLLCIDEFELDDPGNTLIVKSFLAPFFAGGGNVVTTSNTPPEAQGAGRFNADDFRREIQSIAARFTVLPVGGPDYRERIAQGELADATEWEQRRAQTDASEPRVVATFDELQAFLGSVHPVRYRGVLRQIGTLYVRGVRPIRDQSDALRFVHFIDKLYDLEVDLIASGNVRLRDLFDATYRRGAFQKKYDRCLSRLGELLGAATATPAAS
jgi:cell division protein ZapE